MTDLAAARTRIGRVKIKGGADLHILHRDDNSGRGRIERDVRKVLDAADGAGMVMAGFAIVCWSEDCRSIYQTWCGPESFVPDVLVGAFVSERLRSCYAADLAIAQVNDAWGPPS